MKFHPRFLLSYPPRGTRFSTWSVLRVVQAAIGIGWTGLESFALGRVATSASDQKRPFWTMPFNVRFMPCVDIVGGRENGTPLGESPMKFRSIPNFFLFLCLLAFRPRAPSNIGVKANRF